MLLLILPVTAMAEGEYTEVGTAEAFKQALESNGDKNIIVTRDIIYTCQVSEVGDYWITLGRGQKILNLNGKSVELNAETGEETTMILVPKSADLIINDTSGDNSGRLFCYGRMESVTSDRGPRYLIGAVKYRNVLEIDGGMVTINGGTLEAGRSKKMWVYDGKDVYSLRHLLDYTIQFGVLGLAIGARYDGYAWQQVNGDCITVNDGTLMVNDGIFLGRGFSKLETYVKANDNDVDVEFSRSACLRLLGGATIINGGMFHGKGNADVFGSRKDAKVTIKNGTFSTNNLRVLLVPTLNLTLYGYWCPYVIGHEQRYGYQYHPASNPGATGIRAEMLDPARNTVEVNGEILPASEWTDRKLGYGWVGNDFEQQDTIEIVVTHHLSNADRRNYARGDIAAKTINAAAVLGTLALGVPLDSDTLELSASNVKNIHTEWYHNGEVAEDDSVVSCGSYQAKITLVAENGYIFTEDTDFAVMGKTVKNKDLEISINGKKAYIWSDVYEFECNHHLNDDTSIHYDEQSHYLLCTFCGKRYSEEKHNFIKNETDGNYIRYYCFACDYYIEKADDGKIKIDAIDLRVADPEVGKNPDYYIAIAVGDGISTTEISDEYTENGVKWTKAGTGFEVKKDDLFVGGMWYRAHIKLQIGDGYSLLRNENDQYSALVYVNNTEAKYDVDGNVITVYYEYICPEVKVSSINMYGIDWPEVGNTPDCTVESENPGYYGLKPDSGSVSWYEDGEYMDKASKFKAGKTYTVKLYVDAVRVGWDDVVTFNNSLAATVNGFTVRTENIERLHDTTVVLTFRFPTLEEEKELEKTTETDTTFTDISKGQYYYDAVLWAVEQGITGGTSATTFSPDAPCTRGQVVTFLHRMVASPDPAPISMPFIDVKENAYYYKPVKWALGSHVTGGTSDTTFSPDASCTRGQVVTFLWRTAGQPEAKTNKCSFTDVKSDSYYYKAVLWAVEQGITGGTSSTTFSPDASCTRGQVVTFLYRFINGQ